MEKCIDCKYSRQCFTIKQVNPECCLKDRENEKKDEIKEIINDLQRVADRKCYPEDILDGSIAQEWVDYITNLKEEKDKEIEILKKEKSILEKSLKLIWKKDIKINYEELDKANKIIEKEVGDNE